MVAVATAAVVIGPAVLVPALAAPIQDLRSSALVLLAPAALAGVHLTALLARPARQALTAVLATALLIPVRPAPIAEASVVVIPVVEVPVPTGDSEI